MELEEFFIIIFLWSIYRAVSKSVGMQLAAWSRIEQLRISFGSVFLLFPMKVAEGSRSCGQGIFSPEIKTVK